MPDTSAIVGYVGFYVSMGATNKNWSARLLAVLFFVHNAHPARVAS
jgi:hypothetical protein